MALQSQVRASLDQTVEELSGRMDGVSRRMLELREMIGRSLELLRVLIKVCGGGGGGRGGVGGVGGAASSSSFARLMLFPALLFLFAVKGCDVIDTRSVTFFFLVSIFVLLLLFLQGLQHEVPRGWEARVDRNMFQAFFVNHENQVSPQESTVKKSRGSRRPFFPVAGYR